MKIWRLTTRNTISEAFNGQGASIYGGRFNSKGTKIVYCSQSVSLAILENLVHFDADICPSLFLYEVDLDGKEIFLDESLIDGLTKHTAENFKKVGDEWVGTGKSLALKVPTIIVPLEYNYLINPSHPNFANLKITPHGLFKIDQRLFAN